jgi:hypothetical protein
VAFLVEAEVHENVVFVDHRLGLINPEKGLPGTARELFDDVSSNLTKNIDNARSNQCWGRGWCCGDKASVCVLQDGDYTHFAGNLAADLGNLCGK